MLLLEAGDCMHFFASEMFKNVCPDPVLCTLYMCLSNCSNHSNPMLTRCSTDKFCVIKVGTRELFYNAPEISALLQTSLKTFNPKSADRYTAAVIIITVLLM